MTDTPTLQTAPENGSVRILINQKSETHKMLTSFDNHQYLNIETFRKNGSGVKTPVWFAREGETLIVWTETQSGKAKRIRQNGYVNIAPCTASGEPLGEWIAASAQVHDSTEEVARVTQSMRRKYGIPLYSSVW